MYKKRNISFDIVKYKDFQVSLKISCDFHTYNKLQSIISSLNFQSTNNWMSRITTSLKKQNQCKIIFY